MDRRFVLIRFARARAAIRRLLPAPIETRAVDAWNRIQGRYRRRRADIVIVSYPKAGRTWLCLMLSRALCRTFDVAGEPSTDVESLHDADRRIPRIFCTHDGVMPRMRAESVRRDKTRYAHQSVILLVRDPRDVVVSDFHHLRERMRVVDVDIDTFVLGDESGMDTVLAFHRAWRDGLTAPRRTLVVRYEDLHRDPARELGRMLAFLGVSASDDAVAEAVSVGEFSAMRALERSGKHPNRALRTVDGSNDDAHKVRRGAIGGHRDEVREATRVALDEKLRAAGLAAFGYPGDGPVA